MTIVLQHQFRALEVGDDAFSVNLSFQNRSERLTIPFAAVTPLPIPRSISGSSSKLRQPQPAEAAALPRQIPPPEAAEPERPAAEIVTLDKFRKR